MEKFEINHWAVIVAALSNLVVGAIWYSPVMFYSAWKKENNLTDDDLNKTNPAVLYSISTILALMMCYNMAFFLADAQTDWQWGTTAGFLTGFGWAGAIFAVVALFEMKSWRYIAINAGYMVVYFTLVGFILGIWR